VLADAPESNEPAPDTPRAPWRMKKLVPSGIYIGQRTPRSKRAGEQGVEEKEKKKRGKG
jgi:hypothetical protein